MVQHDSKHQETKSVHVTACTSHVQSCSHADQQPQSKIKGIAASLTKGHEAIWFVFGCVVLCAVVSLVAACPLLLPQAYLVLACLGMPWRIVSFWRRGWAFFLIDFCYVSYFALYISSSNMIYAG